MTIVATEITYIGFILPTLFSLTLIGEGVYKIIKSGTGYATISIGMLFLIGIILGYVFVFLR